MMVELTDPEVLEAMTEWLNEHRFKEPVRVTNVKLSTFIHVGNSSAVASTMHNIIYFEYPRKELANE